MCICSLHYWINAQSITKDPANIVAYTGVYVHISYLLVPQKHSKQVPCAPCAQTLLTGVTLTEWVEIFPANMILIPFNTSTCFSVICTVHLQPEKLGKEVGSVIPRHLPLVRTHTSDVAVGMTQQQTCLASLLSPSAWSMPGGGDPWVFEALCLSSRHPDAMAPGAGASEPLEQQAGASRTKPEVDTSHIRVTDCRKGYDGASFFSKLFWL